MTVINDTIVHCVIYLNHVDRKEYDCVMFRRKPGFQNGKGGPIYICYYSDVPNNLTPTQSQNKSRYILLTDSIKGVQDYVEDMLDLITLDMTPFEKMDIDTCLYPSVTLSPSTASERRRLILRCIEDSLSSERISA